MANMPVPAQGPEEEMQEDQAPAQGVAMLSKAQGADPMAVKAITGALESFQTGVQALLGNGQGAVAAPGAAPMEAGGSDKAVPAM